MTVGRALYGVGRVGVGREEREEEERFSIEERLRLGVRPGLPGKLVVRRGSLFRVTAILEEEGLARA